MILVHIEIEGRWRGTHPERMARYYFHLKARYPGEPVVPIALFLKGGPRGIEVREWKEEVDGFEVCCFRYRAFGLSGSEAAEYLGRPNPLAWALAALMGSRRLAPAEQKLECLRRIARSGLDDARTFLLGNIVETYLELTGDELRRYKERLGREDEKEIAEMKQTWAEGIYAKGKSEGLSRGREEGARELVLELLEHRFGVPGVDVRRRLDSITDSEDLRRLARRITEARSLSELGLDG